MKLLRKFLNILEFKECLNLSTGRHIQHTIILMKINSPGKSTNSIHPLDLMNDKCGNLFLIHQMFLFLDQGML